MYGDGPFSMFCDLIDGGVVSVTTARVCQAIYNVKRTHQHKNTC